MHHKSSGWESDLQSNSSENVLVLVFAATTYFEERDVFKELSEKFPNAILMGCSTAGEILGVHVYDDSMVVVVAEFEHTKLVRVNETIKESDDSEQAGKKLSEKLVGAGLKSVFVLSDGLAVNGSQLVSGLRCDMPKGVVITGGLAGDGPNFKRTWILRDGVPVQGCISAVGFYGERLKVGYGSKGGWDNFGPIRTITKSKNNVVFEIDGKPVLDLYKKYLGEKADGLPSTGLLFPLALTNPDDSISVVRTVLAIDEETKSMIFAGDLPEGHKVRLMKANFDSLIDGAEEAASITNGLIGEGTQTLTLAISCVGRKLVLGERIEDEVEATMDVLPKDTVQAGFYSYGEISPTGAGSCNLHNQTMTLTAFQEV